jgi:hypothetical protein
LKNPTRQRDRKRENRKKERAEADITVRKDPILEKVQTKVSWEDAHF